ncbi:MAG: WbqC family protein [Bacteroides sp.]|nr:WbqC family protein [Roseburia sp.]MCM1347182.1 WbqC family protein [Bacteroides sp.]MCM1421670.1 WbqC family protein [Bacteroides sp.]
MDIYLSSAYLPPVQYFTKIVAGGRCFVEQYENYVKQTYRTRCVIDSPNGPLSLTVPVEKPDTAKCLMKDVRLSEHDNWRHKHWQALASSYFNSPFFEFYQDDFRPFYEKRWDFLMDFNEALMEKCCELIDISPQCCRTECYMPPANEEHKTEDNALYGSAAETVSGIRDFRTSLSPKSDWRLDSEFVPEKYYQVFAHKHGFLPNLSIIDLLFNMGPESVIVLNKSTASPEQSDR